MVYIEGENEWYVLRGEMKYHDDRPPPTLHGKSISIYSMTGVGSIFSKLYAQRISDPQE